MTLWMLPPLPAVTAALFPHCQCEDQSQICSLHSFSLSALASLSLGDQQLASMLWIPKIVSSVLSFAFFGQKGIHLQKQRKASNHHLIFFMCRVYECVYVCVCACFQIWHLCFVMLMSEAASILPFYPHWNKFTLFANRHPLVTIRYLVGRSNGWFRHESSLLNKLSRKNPNVLS